MRVGWLALLLPGLAMAQPLARSRFDDGTIVGRVCDDLDGDGFCSDGEPGIQGVRVMLETGLTSVTDAQGRYHLASVEGRAPANLSGLRLLPGRHRVALDRTSLEVTPRGATLEVPAGAVVLQNFAVRRRAEAVAVAAPEVRASNGVISARLHGVAPEGTRVIAGSESVEADASGAWAIWVPLSPGDTTVVFAEQRLDGEVRLVSRRFGVVPRPGGALVVPGALVPLGELAFGVDPSAPPVVRGIPADRIRVTADRVGHRVELRLGETTTVLQLPPVDRARARVVGLLDLEAGLELRSGGVVPRLAGRGAAALRAHVFGFDVSGELDLRDTDVVAIANRRSAALLEPRELGIFERGLDLVKVPPGLGDQSATVATNASGQRLRLEIAREGLGALRLGSVRPLLAASDVGRFTRAMNGGQLSLQVGHDGSKLGLEATGWVTDHDVLSGFRRAQAHEQLESTGGSLYWLGHGEVVQGSEWLRVEVRDRLSGVPLAEQHLLRGRDYQIDFASGRVLLAAPLALFVGGGVLGADGLLGGGVPVLVVDYEHLDAATRDSAGGVAELSGELGPVKASAAVVRETAGYSLQRGRVSVTLGAWRAEAEVAHSLGAVRGLAFNDSGGLGPFVEAPVNAGREGWATTARVRGPGLFSRGFVDGAFRRRSSGFSDTSASLGTELRQWSLRAEQPLGPVAISALVDDRLGADWRTPFGTESLHTRVLGGGVGWIGEGWGVRVDARDSQVERAAEIGARTSVGVSGHWQAKDWLTLRASHRQRVAERGSGPGAWDDTVALVGGDVRVASWGTLGVAGGWGPVVGPVARASLGVQRGEERWYGAVAHDVDAPVLGEVRSVSGVSREVAPGSAVFVEDVAAHDVDGLRLGRAMGFSQQLSESLSASARFERGARSFLFERPELVRTAGGVSVSWVSARVRVSGRGEVRFDDGRLSALDTATGQRVQWLGVGSAEVSISETVSASAWLQWAHAADDGLLRSRNLAASASLAWRPGWGALVLRYTAEKEILPPPRAVASERQLQVVSLLPTVKLGDRFAVAAGGHLGFTPQGPIVAASLRPSVRVWRGLELAAEVARRSVAVDLGELTAVRGEAGWRFDDRFLVALGVSAFGYAGLGLDAGAPGSANRLYLRVEASP